VRVDRFGHLLYELSLLERAQPQPVCDWIDFPDDSFARIGISGATCRIDMAAGRPAIATALRAVWPVADPGAPRRDLDPACLHRDLFWGVPLRDLGLFSADMTSISRTRAPGRVPWRYHRIERTGATVWITVRGGGESLTRTVRLDPAGPPSAVPIDIAHQIRSSSAGPGAGSGPSPSRTDRLASWARARMRPR
jgi:hypothetical protein